MSYEDVPGRLGKWLERYPLNTAKWSQTNLLRIFFQAIYGVEFKDLRGGKSKTLLRKERVILINDYFEEYISEYESRNFTDDLITTINWMNTRPKPFSYRSVGGVYGGLKTIFSRQPENEIDKRYTVDEMDDKEIRRRHIPRTGDELGDDKLTKAQLRSIFEHLSIQHKAFALFAVSSGMRPSAITRILLEDMDLDGKPPFAKLRQKRGGKKVPKRIWYSYEARDAINEWLKLIKTEGDEEPKIRKKTGGKYDPNKPLNVSYGGAWINALKKAGLDEMYEMPRKKRHVYHFGTLRKFFYTEMKNDGMDLDIVNAMMGHEAYLADAYDRTGVEKLAEVYLEHMGAVMIYVKEEEFVSDQTYIKSEDMDIYKDLGWRYSGHILPDGRVSMDWNRSGKPKYPIGDEDA